MIRRRAAMSVALVPPAILALALEVACSPEIGGGSSAEPLQPTAGTTARGVQRSSPTDPSTEWDTDGFAPAQSAGLFASDPPHLQRLPDAEPPRVKKI